VREAVYLGLQAVNARLEIILEVPSVQLPTKFELNLKTALGLDMPPTIIVRAAEVIE
jgi:hypothetical protein